MNLLGDIGQQDQLTAARAENAMLHERVKQLTQKVQSLQIEKEVLAAEVEMYRKEAAMPNFSNLALGAANKSDGDAGVMNHSMVDDPFIKSGNGVYCRQPDVILPQLHGRTNILSCTLTPDEAVLVTGGADGKARLCYWSMGGLEGSTAVVQNAAEVSLPAPVVCVAAAPLRNVIACACMDGSIHVLRYETTNGSAVIQVSHWPLPAKHGKYVRQIAWNAPSSSSSSGSLLASCSADGTVHVFRVSQFVDDVTVGKLTTLHLNEPVESCIFTSTQLVCYARNTPHLTCFDPSANWKISRLHLNPDQQDDHVSFCVMDMALCVINGHDYLALATDTSRNMIVDVAAERVVRDLYGHVNDAYAQPKVAFSANGQYVYGNTQDANDVCVWELASAHLVQRLTGHDKAVRDLYASPTSNVLVTTSYDKKTVVWLEGDRAEAMPTSPGPTTVPSASIDEEME